ncbi:MAG: sulfite exporter TauE/SafE family protein, partial [Desulfobulbaceae bacterium]|nr:sulfite exporter TauE/SafE family protein [Desulfobulbaceae bacterium]
QIETYLQGSLLLAFTAAYVGGLLASLTPCVYPMIPITAGVISNSNIGGSKLRGFLLSLVYITGMALTYAALGIFAAATGRFFGTINTSPWTFFIVGNIILLLGLGMLDVFRLPTFAVRMDTKIKGMPGVFIVGMASGLIAGPCTAPVLGALLAYVASTGNLFLGGSLLFVFSFGMGAILLVVGTFSGILASIPRSGNWMVIIKKTMGVFMIGLAEYFLIQAGMMFV